MAIIIIIMAQATSHAPCASNCARAEGLHFSAFHYTIYTTCLIITHSTTLIMRGLCTFKVLFIVSCIANPRYCVLYSYVCVYTALTRSGILMYCTNEILHTSKYQLLHSFVVYVVYTRSDAFDDMPSHGIILYNS